MTGSGFSRLRNSPVTLWVGFLRDAEQALTRYERAVELSPNTVGAHEGAARALGALGRADEARASREEAERLKAALGVSAAADSQNVDGNR